MPGIVILTTVPSGSVTGFSPPMSTSPSPPAALLNTITPVAPETWARPILLSNRQAPRSISAILPAGVAEEGSAGLVTARGAGSRDPRTQPHRPWLALAD